jgi:catechol 2,3-dioxygenase
LSKNRAPNRPIVAPKFHHTTFTTLRLDEMVAWYCNVAGLTPVYHGESAAWLTNDEANHRIAFLSPPGLKNPVDKPHTIGLHHTAFEYADFDAWMYNYVRLRDSGIVPFLTLDHGMTISLYYADPEGNGVEIQVDTFGDWSKSKEWMSGSLEFAEDQLGAHFDPDKLVEAWQAGLSFEEIHRRTRAGEYAPAVIPTDIFLPEVY